MKLTLYWSAAMVLAAQSLAFAQHLPGTPTPLAALLAEAGASNTQITAAEHGVRAARQVAPQKRTLPDPQFTLQQFAVGSPRPFAGYTNSDFAYVGIGASQELPYPGKLRLKAEVAERAADTQQAMVEVARTSVGDSVKTDYIQLAYMQQTLEILRKDESIVSQLIQDATLHYTLGRGMQQDVLQAQVERTKIVRDITMHHQQQGLTEAHLKGLLHRDQGSPDIVTELLIDSPIQFSSTQLLDQVRQHNPQLLADAGSVRKQDAQLAAAKRDGKPDFGVSYMYQQTDRKYRDYYMLSFDVQFPRKGRVHAEIAEASEMLAQSKDALDAELQRQLADAQQQYVRAASDEDLLKEYREGLIPQSEAVYRATLSAYAANREQFPHVLLYFTDLLNLNLEVAKTLADHETALASLESLTGATLR